jgi:hypothetical protein
VPVSVGANIKVLRLIFDPKFEFNGKTFRQTFGWFDPFKLMDDFNQDLLDTSGGFARYKIVEAATHPYDGYPPDINGHVFSDSELYNRMMHGGWANLIGVAGERPPDTVYDAVSLGKDSATMRYAQSFRVWGAGLTRIRILLSRVGSPTKPIKVTVRKALDGVDLLTWIVPPEKVVGTSPTEASDVEVNQNSFDLPLENGVLYYLVAQFSDDPNASPDPDNHYRINVAKTPDGHINHTDQDSELFVGTSWDRVSATDMHAYLYFYQRTDYRKFFATVPFKIGAQTRSIADHVRAGRIDEVWAFGGPLLGMLEAMMLGPGAYDINGGVEPNVNSGRLFVVMGFNYEVGVGNMLHSYGHRTEGIMKHAYGAWNNQYGSTPGEVQIITNWDKFTSFYGQTIPGASVCGNVHWPANATHDYEYDNQRQVPSSADDWLSYPNLRGTVTQVGGEATWGRPYRVPGGQPGTTVADYQRNYLVWWFKRLPKANERNADGKLNNWWRYVVQPDYYKQASADREPKRVSR